MMEIIPNGHPEVISDVSDQKETFVSIVSLPDSVTESSELQITTLLTPKEQSAALDLPASQDIAQSGKQPTAREELELIRQACPVLAPTGCTPQFCQAGRMIHLDEPRVGQDRPLAEVQRDAIAFLQECRAAGVLKTDVELETRLRQTALQIKAGAVQKMVKREDGCKEKGVAGGSWILETNELEYGLRAAWRNARRCIMRSQHMELELCDLRHIKSSREMATAIIERFEKAFDNGNIQPTVLVFPPREVGKRGPMIWNNQILAFAGYRMDDDTILGDPGNVDLTESFIDMGWDAPDPATRSQWDLLPLITMAEDDEPVITELPESFRPLVSIQHPRYPKEFEDLDLKWVAAPALSRFGFDIGGVQFTAAPFIGWFMDAEVGVRNLSDTFRYNALPRVAKALKLYDGAESREVEDLQEYERLAALSRAQTELNYAVYWSFQQAKVNMVDTLTAQTEFIEYDDEFKREKGFRQAADPYWLSPPQGSIIPLWHRGGAPNYQPKPMICHHVQDPVKAYWREHQDRKHRLALHESAAAHRENVRDMNSSSQNIIKIHYCSAGITAAKIANRLHSRVSALIKTHPEFAHVHAPEPLNRLDLTKLHAKDVVLLVVSTTGQGHVPPNGVKFLTHATAMGHSDHAPRYSIFANGDSHYGDSFNAAAHHINDAMKHIGSRPIAEGLYIGDTAAANPPWSLFDNWWRTLDILLFGADGEVPQTVQVEHAVAASLPYTFSKATLANAIGTHLPGVVQVTFDLGTEFYQEMDHVRFFPPNSSGNVQRILKALRASGEELLQMAPGITLAQYLRECVALDLPFKTMAWVDKLEGVHPTVTNLLHESPLLDALKAMGEQDYSRVLDEVCADMASIRPRSYSVASSPHSLCGTKQNALDVLVTIHVDGEFSDKFLTHAEQGTPLRYSINRLSSWELFCHPEAGPVIAVTTGSGLGPVRSLLQRRTAETKKSAASGAAEAPFAQSKISLFAGFKPTDASIVEATIQDAKSQDLFDVLELVPSNAEKVRVQDRIMDPKVAPKIAEKLRHPGCLVFVCTNEIASDAIAFKFSTLLGQDAREAFGSRYVEEVFRYK